MKLVTALIALTASAAQLTIQVTDETGKPVWARLEIHGPDGRMHQPPDGIRSGREADSGRSAYLGSFVVNGATRLDLPPARYRLVAEHGLEYPRIERMVTLPSAGATVPLSMKPWIRMNQRGWYSADFHVHRPLEDMPALAQAEDVNLNVVFTMWNRRNLWSDQRLPDNPVQTVSARRLLTLMNAEDERAGGAWMFHQIPEPLGLEKTVPEGQPVTGSWHPPGLEFIRRVRLWRKPGDLFPWFDAEKTIWWEVPVVMALESPDSLGLLNNHFQQYGMLDNEAWGRPREKNKDFAGYILSLYYRYLNLGFRLPPSGGSASGVLPNPVGYNRIYVPVTGQFTAEKWYSSFREHRGFVTNGPMLFWKPELQGNRLRVSVEAMAREPIDRIDIVANGKVIGKVDAAPGARTLLSALSVDVSGHSWVAARCFLKTPHTTRMAHTSPIYLTGKWDSSEDARYFLEWIDELTARTSDQPAKDSLHALYRRAREFYAAKAQKTLANPAAGADLYRKGVAWFNQGRLSEAADLLRKAVSQDPDNPEVQKALGVALAAGNDYHMAEPHFARACALRPGLEDACYYHARALYLLDRYIPAIEQFRKLLPSDPEPGRVYWGLAQALEAAGLSDEAEAAYRKSIDSGHRAARPDGDTRLLYGLFLYRQGRIEEALAMYRKAIASRPDSSRAHAELGRACLQTGKTGDAVTHLREALTIDPANEAARLLLDKAKARLAVQGSSTDK